MTLRKMVDSANPDNVIKTNPQMAAGYIDGNYRTFPILQAKLKLARLVSITVHGGTVSAHVCDTEPGNVGVPGAVSWARGRIRSGHHAALYCMAYQWPAVRAEVRKQMSYAERRKVWYWLAEWDGKQSISFWRRRRHVVAKQYASSDAPQGSPGYVSGGKDLSVVLPYWPGVDPAPKPAKARALTAFSRYLAKRLNGRLSTRKVSLDNVDDRKLLTQLHDQINRVLDI